MKNKSVLVVLIGLLLLPFAVQAKDEFPGRVKFPDVQTIELDDLYKKRNDVIIVDARSSYEYETLRIKGAANVSLSSKKFAEELQALRKTHGDKPIVFYCNGKTCFKSYKAVRKAMFHKIPNVMSFDAGIFDWAKSYPAEAVLLGETPINPKHLISKKELNKRMLTPQDFGKRVGKGAMVMDVRDTSQREGVGFFPGQERRISLDDKRRLLAYIRRAKDSGKPLMVYDAVGKQVRWLQYTIEREGLKEYYFMKGGAKGYYEMLTKK